MAPNTPSDQLVKPKKLDLLATIPRPNPSLSLWSRAAQNSSTSLDPVSSLSASISSWMSSLRSKAQQALKETQEEDSRFFLQLEIERKVQHDSARIDEQNLDMLHIYLENQKQKAVLLQQSVSVDSEDQEVALASDTKAYLSENDLQEYLAEEDDLFEDEEALLNEEYEERSTQWNNQAPPDQVFEIGSESEDEPPASQTRISYPVSQLDTLAYSAIQSYSAAQQILAPSELDDVSDEFEGDDYDVDAEDIDQHSDMDEEIDGYDEAYPEGELIDVNSDAEDEPPSENVYLSQSETHPAQRYPSLHHNESIEPSDGTGWDGVPSEDAGSSEVSQDEAQSQQSSSLINSVRPRLSDYYPGYNHPHQYNQDVSDSDVGEDEAAEEFDPEILGSEVDDESQFSPEVRHLQDAPLSDGYQSPSSDEVEFLEAASESEDASRVEVDSAESIDENESEDVIMEEDANVDPFFVQLAHHALELAHTVSQAVSGIIHSSDGTEARVAGSAGGAIEVHAEAAVPAESTTTAQIELSAEPFPLSSVIDASDVEATNETVGFPQTLDNVSVSSWESFEGIPKFSTEVRDNDTSDVDINGSFDNERFSTPDTQLPQIGVENATVYYDASLDSTMFHEVDNYVLGDGDVNGNKTGTGDFGIDMLETSVADRDDEEAAADTRAEHIAGNISVGDGLVELTEQWFEVGPVRGDSPTTDYASSGPVASAGVIPGASPILNEPVSDDGGNRSDQDQGNYLPESTPFEDHTASEFLSHSVGLEVRVIPADGVLIERDQSELASVVDDTVYVDADSGTIRDIERDDTLLRTSRHDSTSSASPEIVEAIRNNLDTQILQQIISDNVHSVEQQRSTEMANTSEEVEIAENETETEVEVTDVIGGPAVVKVEIERRDAGNEVFHDPMVDFEADEEKVATPESFAVSEVTQDVGSLSANETIFYEPENVNKTASHEPQTINETAFYDPQTINETTFYDPQTINETAFYDPQSANETVFYGPNNPLSVDATEADETKFIDVLDSNEISASISAALTDFSMPETIPEPGSATAEVYGDVLNVDVTKIDSPEPTSTDIAPILARDPTSSGELSVGIVAGEMDADTTQVIEVSARTNVVDDYESLAIGASEDSLPGHIDSDETQFFEPQVDMEVIGPELGVSKETTDVTVAFGDQVDETHYFDADVTEESSVVSGNVFNPDGSAGPGDKTGGQEVVVADTMVGEETVFHELMGEQTVFHELIEEYNGGEPIDEKIDNGSEGRNFPFPIETAESDTIADIPPLNDPALKDFQAQGGAGNHSVHEQTTVNELFLDDNRELSAANRSAGLSRNEIFLKIAPHLRKGRGKTVAAWTTEDSFNAKIEAPSTGDGLAEGYTPAQDVLVTDTTHPGDSLDVSLLLADEKFQLPAPETTVEKENESVLPDAEPPVSIKYTQNTLLAPEDAKLELPKRGSRKRSVSPAKSRSVSSPKARSSSRSKSGTRTFDGITLPDNASTELGPPANRTRNIEWRAISDGFSELPSSEAMTDITQVSTDVQDPDYTRSVNNTALEFEPAPREEVSTRKLLPSSEPPEDSDIGAAGETTTQEPKEEENSKNIKAEENSKELETPAAAVKPEIGNSATRLEAEVTEGKPTVSPKRRGRPPKVRANNSAVTSAAVQVEPKQREVTSVQAAGSEVLSPTFELWTTPGLNVVSEARVRTPVSAFAAINSLLPTFDPTVQGDIQELRMAAGSPNLVQEKFEEEVSRSESAKLEKKRPDRKSKRVAEASPGKRGRDLDAPIEEGPVRKRASRRRMTARDTEEQETSIPAEAEVLENSVGTSNTAKLTKETFITDTSNEAKLVALETERDVASETGAKRQKAARRRGGKTAPVEATPEVAETEALEVVPKSARKRLSSKLGSKSSVARDGVSKAKPKRKRKRNT
ncbi:hypothetical protein BABINDRAFT_162789 [Babjeviella inositovora NRRL Y-12698]|uniref:Uncharacterized protein n=1 Tax=Babjeviella inositovora NRRL Y-12698 TaxID=984486 RepID=A0A1E3QM97_9ASCO|nr:uncharacterized protein BABINDRAFT_162789 [Babjeviella inositovora NRRL Y-12698]ODQ78584.1 hypothetical protein BABINDRAFT_162789 [Babjeviella inositovora NRRL Y-12698]